MKYFALTLILSVVAAVAVLAWPHGGGKLGPGEMRFGNSKIQVEIADTDVKQAKGLSGRQGLAPDAGMLFVFSRPDKYSFWMPDMHFALDMIWMDSDGVIVDITRDVQPDSYPATFSPIQPAQYVLEVNAGYAAAHKIEVGQKAVLPVIGN